MTVGKNTKRLFVAIPPSAKFQSALASYKNIFPGEERVRWIQPDHFHVTAHFIGDVPADTEPHITEVMEAVASNTPSFSLILKDVIFAPPHRKGRERMIWAQFHPHPAFTSLVDKLREELIQYGDAQKTPLPHITLARFREKPDITLTPTELEEHAMEVDRLELWESHRQKDGVTYLTRAKGPLTGAYT